MSNPGNSALMLFIQERSWGKGHCWSSREQPLVIRKRWLFVQIQTCRDEGLSALHRPPGIHLLEWPATKSSTLGRTHFSPEKGTWGAREHRIIWFPTRLCSSQNELLLPITHFPPCLLEKHLTFSTAILVVILFVVICVQDRPVGVGVAGPGLPLAFGLRGTEGFWRLSQQPGSQQLGRCLSQLVFGCETVKGTETQGGVKLRATLGDNANCEKC